MPVLGTTGSGQVSDRATGRSERSEATTAPRNLRWWDRAKSMFTAAADTVISKATTAIRGAMHMVRHTPTPLLAMASLALLQKAVAEGMALDCDNLVALAAAEGSYDLAVILPEMASDPLFSADLASICSELGLPDPTCGQLSDYSDAILAHVDPNATARVQAEIDACEDLGTNSSTARSTEDPVGAFGIAVQGGGDESVDASTVATSSAPFETDMRLEDAEDLDSTPALPSVTWTPDATATGRVGGATLLGRQNLTEAWPEPSVARPVTSPSALTTLVDNFCALFNQIHPELGVEKNASVPELLAATMGDSRFESISSRILTGLNITDLVTIDALSALSDSKLIDIINTYVPVALIQSVQEIINECPDPTTLSPDQITTMNAFSDALQSATTKYAETTGQEPRRTSSGTRSDIGSTSGDGMSVSSQRAPGSSIATSGPHVPHHSESFTRIQDPTHYTRGGTATHGVTPVPHATAFNESDGLTQSQDAMNPMATVGTSPGTTVFDAFCELLNRFRADDDLSGGVGAPELYAASRSDSEFEGIADRILQGLNITKPITVDALSSLPDHKVIEILTDDVKPSLLAQMQELIDSCPVPATTGAPAFTAAQATVFDAFTQAVTEAVDRATQAELESRLANVSTSLRGAAQAVTQAIGTSRTTAEAVANFTAYCSEIHALLPEIGVDLNASALDLSAYVISKGGHEELRDEIFDFFGVDSELRQHDLSLLSVAVVKNVLSHDDLSAQISALQALINQCSDGTTVSDLIQTIANAVSQRFTSPSPGTRPVTKAAPVGTTPGLRGSVAASILHTSTDDPNGADSVSNRTNSSTGAPRAFESTGDTNTTAQPRAFSTPAPSSATSSDKSTTTWTDAVTEWAEGFLKTTLAPLDPVADETVAATSAVPRNTTSDAPASGMSDTLKYSLIGGAAGLAVLVLTVVACTRKSSKVDPAKTIPTEVTLEVQRLTPRTPRSDAASGPEARATSSNSSSSTPTPREDDGHDSDASVDV